MQRMRRQRTAAGIAHARCLPCMRTRFCSFLPHFARESGSMFLRGREGELQDPCRCFVPSIAGLAGWRCCCFGLACLSDGDPRGHCEYCGLICHQLRRGRAVHNCCEVYRRSLYSTHVLSLLLSPHTTYYFSRLNLRSLLLHPSIPILHPTKVIV